MMESPVLATTGLAHILLFNTMVYTKTRSLVMRQVGQKEYYINI